MSKVYLISHTQKDGVRVTNQRYTAEFVSQRLKDLEEWGCYDIEVKEEK